MKDFLSNYLSFSDNEYERFISIAKERIIKKEEHLLIPDHPVNKLFFVKSGLMRGYRIKDGVDLTHHFFVENWLATDYESYLTGNNGELYIQAITETRVYEFRKDVLFQYYADYPEFEKIRFVQAEDAYLQMVNRLKGFQLKDLKERYTALINKSPDLFKLVPQKHIASYLGVAPQSLSRIKKS